MGWVRVPKEEFARIRKLAADRKAKREEKRKSLPWRDDHPAQPGPRRRRKRTPVQIAWDRNDALWSLLVRRRDTAAFGPRCRICGQTAESVRAAMVGYHLVPKKRGCVIRWLPEDGVQGCARCNFGERMNPGKYRDKHIALVGQARMEELEALAKPGTQFRLDDLLAIGAWLKAVIEAAPGQEPQRPPCLPVVKP